MRYNVLLHLVKRLIWTEVISVVYGDVLDFHLLGCFPDNVRSKPAIDSLEGRDFMLDGDPAKRSNAIEKCARITWINGYQVFGIKTGACFTSASAHNTYDRHGPAEACNPPSTIHVYNFTTISANQPKSINIRLGKPFKNCHRTCEDHGEECMVTEHWMWLNKGKKWFTDAGVTCKDTEPEYKGGNNPLVDIRTDKCFGYKNVPKVFNCQGSAKHYRRVCPCRKSAHQFYLGKVTCDKVCKDEKQYCMGTDHGLPRYDTVRVFETLKVTFTKGAELFVEKLGSPRYNPVTKKIIGFKKLGYSIDCFAVPPNPDDERLCPCKRDPGPDYFCQGAEHCWDFELARQGAILDSKTAQPAVVHGSISFTPSPTGNGLRLDRSSNAWLQLGDFSSTCLVDPATCQNGFTISMFVKNLESSDNYYFGNVRKDDLGNPKYVRGVALRTSRADGTIVEVRNGTHLCSLGAKEYRQGVWTHFVISWEPTQSITLTKLWENDKQFTRSKCEPSSISATESIYTLAKDYSQSTQYDNIAIWFYQLNELQIQNIHNYAREIARKVVNVTLDIFLESVTWKPEYGSISNSENSILKSDIVKKVKALYNTNSELDKSFNNVSVSSLREENGSVVAVLHFTLSKPTFPHTLKLQDAFENGKFLNSYTRIIKCSSTHELFCKAPPLPVVSVLSHSQIEVSYNHWSNADTGLMEKVYLFIKKSTDTTWKYASKYMAPNYQKPNSVFGYLTAYANYTIRLVDGGYEGFSLATNLVHARTLEHVPEQAPLITKLQNTSITSIYIEWDRHILQDKVNGILIGFRITWNSATDGFVHQGHKDLGTETDRFNMTGLQSCTSYTIGVSGRTSVGAGKETKVMVQTGVGAPTVPPQNVTLSNTEMSVNLNASWEPIDWHCASSVQGYVIVLRDLTIGQNVGNVTINGAEITTATLIDLHYLHDFSIVVMAFNEVGLGPASPANSSLASSSTYESVPTEGPPITNMENTSSTSIFVQWSRTIPHDKVKGILRGYRISWISTTSGFIHQGHQDVGLETNRYDMTGLRACASYDIGVSGRTSVGAGTESKMLVRTEDGVPTVPPRNVTLSNTEIGVNLNASWQPIDWYCVDSNILGYVIVVRDLTIGQNVRNVTINGAEVTSVTLRDLPYLHNFSIVVMAFNGEGLGTPSPSDNDLAFCSTYESVPWASPQVTVNATSYSTIAVQWTPLANIEFAGVAKGYRVFFTNDSTSWNNQTVDASQVELLIIGLQSYTNYSVQVAGISSKGEGVRSLAVNVTTPDINECLHSLHNCHVDAHCNNTLGSFTCTCNPGWSGDGVNCTDIDECQMDLHTCTTSDGSMACINSVGSYSCLELGPSPSCSDPRPLGMATGQIKDSDITYSSVFSEMHDNGRLHFKPSGTDKGAWVAKVQDTNQWLQVDFHSELLISGVATQGRDDISQWVKSYTLSYSNSGGQFASYNSKQVFLANSDTDTVVKYTLNPLIKARFVRIIPKTWTTHISMRAEFYGCRDVTYHLAKAYQSCNSACEEVNRTCAETGHGFPPDDARFMFSLLGLSCVFTGNLDDYTHASDPLYNEQEDGKISCRGFKNIPAKLRCGATAKFSTIRRICPCKVACMDNPVTIQNIGKEPRTSTLVKFADSFIFETTFSVTGCPETTYEWRLYSTKRQPLSYGQSYTVVSRQANWMLQKRSLLHGLYVLKVFITFNGGMKYDFGFLEIMPSPLLARIEGGQDVVRGQGSIFALDASPSFNKDVGPGNYTGMNFIWLCKKQNESFGNKTHFPEIQVPQQGQISYGNGCFGTGIGRLGSSNRVLKVDAPKMVAGVTYTFRLVVSNAYLNDMYEQYIRLVAGNPPHISISCFSNCERYLNPSEKLRLTSECLNAPCKGQLMYKWTLHKSNLSQWSAVGNLSALTTTGTISKNIAIKKGALELNARYRLTLEAWEITDEQSKGSASYQFTVSTIPYGGNFTVEPAHGESLATLFHFDCANWYDVHRPITYEFLASLGNGLYSILAFGYKSSVEITLPPGDPGSNHTLNVTALISNYQGVFTQEEIFVQVKAHFSNSTVNLTSKIHKLVGNGSELSRWIREEQPFSAFQMAINVLVSLRQVGVDALSKSERTEIKRSILFQLDEIKIASPRDLIMISTVLSLVTEEANELSKEAKDKATEMLQELTKQLQVFRDQNDLSQATYINIAEGNIVSAITKAMNAGTDESPSLTNNTNVTREVQKKSFEGVIGQLDSVVLGVLSDMVAGEDPVTLDLGEVSVVAAKVTPDGLKDMQMGSGDAGVAMPPGDEIAKLAGESPVNAMMTAFGSNPYTWDDSASDVTSGVVSFDLHGVPVSGLSHPISIAMPLAAKPPAPTPTNGTNQPFMKPGTMHVHIMSIEKPGTSAFVTIRPQNFSVSLSLFVQFGARPKPDKYDKIFHLPDLSTCHSKELKANLTNCSSDPFTVFLGDDVINKPGLYYIGVLRSVNKTVGLKRSRRSCFEHRRQKRACVEDKDPPPTVAAFVNKTVVPQYDPRTDVNYTVNIDKQNCLYWSKTKQMWTSEGCKAGAGATGKSIQCLCNHLTSFGGGVVVAPNPIDFDKVFLALSQLSVTGNIAVLATIVAIFLLYIVTAVLARRADKRDQQKIGPPVWLTTNEDANASTYDIIISTGINPNSGTTAKITIVISGCFGSSDPFMIKNDMEKDRILLARGNVDTFVISTLNSLGDLKYINIRHNNFGESPEWFLEYIIVRDRESREEWRFTSYKWLAIDRDDCRIERNIRCEKQLPSNGDFQSVFRSRASNSLYDGHLWLSAITKRPGCTFSRVQRVTCCVCIAMSAMLANAMFYNVDGKEEDTIRIGPLKISLRQIIVGFQSCLVVAPMNILIIWLFKNSRRRRSRKLKQPFKYEENSNREREGGNEQRLPHFCAYIAWFLCFCTIMTSATFTFFYSLMWGKEKANEWLTCMMLSLTQDIMAVQPVKVVATAFVVAFALTKAKNKISKPHKKNKDVLSEEEMNKEQDVVYDKDAPDASELEWYKEEKRKRLRFYAIVREITVFIVFMVVLMAVCFGNTDRNRYLLYKSVKDDFGSFESKASNTDKYWLWLKTKFVSNVYAGQWYNGMTEETEEFIANKRSMIIGMPRLRQLRSKKVPCMITFVDMASCYTFYSSDQEYKVPMNLLHWVPLPENTSWPHALTMCPKPWRYVSSKELGTLPVIGTHAMYGGGGYVAKLGYNEKTAVRVLNELVPNGWIDRQTRAVILEFTVFNTNLNLAAAVSYFYEVLPTGGSTVYTRIETLSLFSTEEGAYEFVLMCQLVFLVMVVGYLVVEGLKLYRQRKEYFLQIWNWLELFLIVSAVLVVALDFVRQKETLKPVKEVQKNPFATVSFHRALLWSEAQNVAMSAVLFLATVKVLNLIRFNSHVILLSWLLKVAGKYLFSFFILLMILQMAFVSAGIYIFGRTSDMFVSIPRGIISQMQFILGKAVPLADLQPQSAVMATLYASMYMFTMTVVFMNMFVVILNESFEDVKEKEDEIAEEKEMADFINTHVTLAIRGAFQKRKTEIRFFVDEFDTETQLNELNEKIDKIKERIDRLECNLL